MPADAVAPNSRAYLRAELAACERRFGWIETLPWDEQNAEYAQLERRIEALIADATERPKLALLRGGRDDA